MTHPTPPKPTVAVTVTSPTTLRVVANGIADATLNVPDANRAAEIARDAFADWGH